MSDIDDLRKIVRQRHRAATNKASRLRRTKGVEVNGTEFDPRRDPSKIKNLTRRELRTYLNALNNFVSRDNSYVAGAEGKPLPKQAFQKYLAAQAQFNQVAESRMASMGHVFVPEKGMTVAQTEATFGRKRADGGRETTSKVDRKASSINGAKALERLTKDLQKKSTKTYDRKSLKNQRNAANKMLAAIGDMGYAERVHGLSNYQFHIAWEYGGLKEELIPKYIWANMDTETRKDDLISALQESGSSDAVENILNWAESLPKQAPRRKS